MKDRTFVSIALANNGRFIASSMGQCLSLWDPSTGAQLGPMFEHHGGRLNSTALLDNNCIAVGEVGIVTNHNLNNILPSPHLGDRTGKYYGIICVLFGQVNNITHSCTAQHRVLLS